MSVTLRVYGASDDDEGVNMSNTKFVELMEYLGVSVLDTFERNGLVGDIDAAMTKRLHNTAKMMLTSIRQRYTPAQLKLPEGLFRMDVLDPRYLHMRLSDIVALCEQAEEERSYLIYS